jgi:hypothetical protein
MVRQYEYQPCIPTRGTKVPAGPGWFHEIKHDGYRLIVRREGKRVAAASQNGSYFVDAFDYGGDNDDARECSRSGTFRGGATWAYGVFGKMPRRRQGMQQSMYLEISNQGRRVERWCARLHQRLSD